MVKHIHTNITFFAVISIGIFTIPSFFLTLAPSVAVPAAMFNELLRPLKEAVGANAAAEPTRKAEAIVSFMVSDPKIYFSLEYVVFPASGRNLPHKKEEFIIHIVEETIDAA